VILVLTFSGVDPASFKIYLNWVKVIGRLSALSLEAGSEEVPANWILKELSRNARMLFLSVLVLDNIIVISGRILMFQFIKKERKL